ncbi:unnamed protein product [Effrenium voratum]|nr:unnamed protein product [Effrenium voratum]
MRLQALVLVALLIAGSNSENCSDCEDAWLVQARAQTRPAWKSPRDLAIVVPPTPMSWGHFQLQFLSAIPVFGNGTNYIALLHDYNFNLWRHATESQLFCASSDRSHKAALKVWGGEMDIPRKRILAFHCPWPQEAADGNYHLIVQSNEGVQLGEIRTKQIPNSLGRHETMACVSIAWNEPGIKPTSTRVPQWLEYNWMHGVDHFLLYTQDGMDEEVLQAYRPYLEEGLATRIHITPVKRRFIGGSPSGHYSTQNWVVNDCLYRAKHHARWVLSYVDWDEYLVLKESAPPTWHGPRFMANLWDQVAATASKTRDDVHAVMLDRYNFATSPVSELDITSTLRESQVVVQPKYVMNPDALNAAFVHQPASWAEGTVALVVPRHMGSFNHYRLPEEKDLGKKRDGMVRDEALVPEVPVLGKAIRDRFRKPWEKLLLELTPVNFSAQEVLAASNLIRADAVGNASEVQTISPLSGLTDA